MSDLMLKLYVSLQNLRAREEGQGMVEYALILVLVSIVAIVALGPLGSEVAVKFTEVTTALTAA